jgi:hypothetical protein
VVVVEVAAASASLSRGSVSCYGQPEDIADVSSGPVKFLVSRQQFLRPYREA